MVPKETSAFQGLGSKGNLGVGYVKKFSIRSLEGSER